MSFLKPSSPSRKSNKSQGRTLAPKGNAKGQERSKQTTRKQTQPSGSFWESLSPERRLDVIGIILAIAGILIVLTLFASSRSAITGGIIRLLSQLVGWGVYILPVGLVVFGLWLILRKIERIPPLSLERAVGSVLLFLWLLTAMHSIIAAPEMAAVAAQDGAGGGYLGSLFERILWFSLGGWGLVIVLIAWMMIALTMILDVTIEDLFGWVGPLAMSLTREGGGLQVLLAKLGIKSKTSPAGIEGEARTNGYTPIDPKFKLLSPSPWEVNREPIYQPSPCPRVHP